MSASGVNAVEEIENHHDHRDEDQCHAVPAWTSSMARYPPGFTIGASSWWVGRMKI
jgi:hypothetical protein